MSTSLLYHTQKVAGFQHQNFFYLENRVIESIKKKEHRCPKCYSGNIKATKTRTRYIQGMPYGVKEVYFKVDVHKYYCYKCKEESQEHLSFLPYPKARVTKALARTLIELRGCMSISDISRHYGVDWHVIKTLEKNELEKKYKHIKLKDVEVIGIDEIHISGNKDTEYITVVRDLKSGAVLHVAEGKGSDALKNFNRRLKNSRCKITAVAMDMSNAYISWAENNLKHADIVFDHFHVIKMMNDKIDQIRRRTYKNLDENKKQMLKNKRFLLLKNIENLDDNGIERLMELRRMFKDLGDANIKKEELRSIYLNAQNELDAEILLKDWCLSTKATEVPELHKMANTIENHMEGILAFWRNNGLSNAYMEGFNNKIRWLIRQAYGYRDMEYFHLKIYDLPNIKRRNEL